MDYTCGVCMEEFEEIGEMVPKVLPGCGHTYCDACLKQLYRTGRWSCPDCSTAIRGVPDDLAKNFALVRGIVQYKERQRNQLESDRRKKEQEQQQNLPRPPQPQRQQQQQQENEKPNYIMEVLPIYLKYVGVCVVLWGLKSLVSAVVPIIAVLASFGAVYFTVSRQPTRT
eukprot:TRINITY_DN19027_c0_g1_i1.p1 TRINITY_DN19027_c0_g1~~TRINITY_DN19027_c0_g1_i1.p1  ORF type:complete len:183 (+),score=25.41 TRINITY_DN19027_c0_g1_i1:40-549(+)